MDILTVKQKNTYIIYHKLIWYGYEINCHDKKKEKEYNY